jgi:hypothetical protein
MDKGFLFVAEHLYGTPAGGQGAFGIYPKKLRGGFVIR